MKQLTNKLKRRWMLALLSLLALSATILILSPMATFADARSRVAAQNSQGVLAIVGGTGADVYDAPDGEAVRSLIAGTALTAVGRTDDATWLQVQLDDAADAEIDSGWVERRQIVIFDAESLPVVDGEREAASSDETADEASIDNQEEVADDEVADDEVADDEAQDSRAQDATSEPSEPTTTPTARPTATPTPRPTNTPAPTATPEPTATPTATATATRRAGSIATRDEIIAVVRSGGASIADAPGENSGSTLPSGSPVTATGRDGASDFVYATTRSGDAGWIAVEELVIFGYEGLPLRDVDGEVAEVDADEASTSDEAEDEDAPQDTEEDEPSTQVVDNEDEQDAPRAATATPLPPIEPRELDDEAVEEAGGVTGTVLLTGSRLNVRGGPDTDSRVIAKALPRANFIVLGRSGDGDWLQVQIEALPDGFGWVAADFLRLSGPVDDLQTTDETTDAPLWTGPALDIPSSTIPPAATATAAAPLTTTIESTVTLNVTQPNPLGTNVEVEADVELNESSSAARDAESSASPSAQATDLSGKLTVRAADGGIYVYNLATGALDRVATGIDPDISRDGSRVAYVREGGDNGVYTVDLATGAEETVYTGGEILRSPKFSPDGSSIAFSRVFGSTECFDTPFACLPTEPPGVPEQVRQSPVYDDIVEDYQEALDDFDRANVPLRMLARIELADNDYRDLPAEYRVRAEDWNEDGIVYSSQGLHITTAEPDGETRLLLPEAWWRDPDWQPGGGAIATFNKDGSDHSEIYLVNPDGNGLRAITRPVTTLVDKLPSNVAPAWSPDGQHIVYLSNRDETNDAGAWRVWVMNADGSNQRPLPLDLPLEYKFDDAQIVSWGA